MKTLIINSYAGSLTIGATQLGCEIIGSYEDANYALDIQKANFPNLNYVEFYKDWPEQDLSDVFVIAHPPCSAFSLANTSKINRGLNSSAFDCTKKVLDYAIRNNAMGVAIESVMGALNGAWEVHQQFADTRGYHLYRILENGCMFGAQWRDRFWVLYLRKDRVEPEATFRIQPRYQTVREVVGELKGNSTGNCEILIERQKQKFLDTGDFAQEDMDWLFKKQDPQHRTTGIINILWEYKFKHLPKWEVFNKYIGGFSSGQLCYVDPDGCCNVILGGSNWYMDGRPMSETSMKQLMGFPSDYIFPEGPKRNYRKGLNQYLSKGVMPPIAAWILEQAAVNLQLMEPRFHKEGYKLTALPNNIADFRIRRSDWANRHKTLPPLRHYDEVSSGQKRERCSLDVISGSEIDKCALWKGHIGECEPQQQRDLFRKRPKLERQLKLITSTGLNARRALMYQIISEIDSPTLSDAIIKCSNHVNIPILPTTCRWHIQQMIKLGYIQEIHDE